MQMASKFACTVAVAGDSSHICSSAPVAVSAFSVTQLQFPCFICEIKGCSPVCLLVVPEESYISTGNDGRVRTALPGCVWGSDGRQD